ncbi:MAG TPA: hypothetical protein VLL08_15540 [Kineosporiaceae bacterium]|nr:hypothetical protein [Kineosporiaceae bacterium]
MRRESSTRSSVRPGTMIVLVALAALGAGVCVTAGLWSHPGSRIVAGNVPDGIHYSWWLGHTPHALGLGENPFRTLDLNWREGVSAMNNTTLLLPAILLWPISALAGSLLSLNLLNILAVPACAAAGYWALRQVPWERQSAQQPLQSEEPGRIGREAALVGAVAFAISPAIVNSLVGHITMAFAPGLALLAGLSVLAWHGDRPVRTGLLLGAVATAQVFTGEEVLFQAVVAAVAILLVAALSRPRAVPAAAGRLIRSLAVAFAIFLPITAYPLYLQFLGPLKQQGSPFLLDFFGADVTAFTTPTSQVLLHSTAQAQKSATFAGGLEEHLAYLGWPLLIVCLLTAVICWRQVAVRCAAVSLAAAMALSLGGRLWINGNWTEHPGPYRLFQALPVTEASLATRFGLLAALFAAALLAFAVHEIGTRVSRPALGAWLAAGVSLVALVPLIPAPLAVVTAPAVPQWFSTTARELPAESVVVVLPYPVAGNPVGMRWQSAANYRFRMPGGYFLGPGPDGHAYVGGSADPPTANLLNRVAETGKAADVTPEERAQAITDLATWGADRIVLGPAPAQAALRETMSDLIGRQPEQVAGVYVWTDPVTK